MTLMGNNGFTPAYFIASEGTIASLNLAYTLPVTNMGKLKAIKFYNDYSYLDKKRDDWSDSQMNTTGMMFIASPFMVWADYTWGKTPTLLVARPTQQGIPLPLHLTVINGYTVLTLISGLLSKVSSIKNHAIGVVFYLISENFNTCFFKLIPKHKGSYKGQNC